MLYTVAIYNGPVTRPRLFWIGSVEAEDRDGACREAMHLIAKGGGAYVMGVSCKFDPREPITWEVTPRSREEPELAILTAFRAAAARALAA
jgi:hypothetical protein